MIAPGNSLQTRTWCLCFVIITQSISTVINRNTSSSRFLVNIVSLTLLAHITISSHFKHQTVFDNIGGFQFETFGSQLCICIHIKELSWWTNFTRDWSIEIPWLNIINVSRVTIKSNDAPLVQNFSASIWIQVIIRYTLDALRVILWIYFGTTKELFTFFFLSLSNIDHIVFLTLCTDLIGVINGTISNQTVCWQFITNSSDLCKWRGLFAFLTNIGLGNWVFDTIQKLFMIETLSLEEIFSIIVTLQTLCCWFIFFASYNSSSSINTLSLICWNIVTIFTNITSQNGVVSIMNNTIVNVWRTSSIVVVKSVVKSTLKAFRIYSIPNCTVIKEIRPLFTFNRLVCCEVIFIGTKNTLSFLNLGKNFTIGNCRRVFFTSSVILNKIKSFKTDLTFFIFFRFKFKTVRNTI